MEILIIFVLLVFGLSLFWKICLSPTIAVTHIYVYKDEHKEGVLK